MDQEQLFKLWPVLIILVISKIISNMVIKNLDKKTRTVEGGHLFIHLLVFSFCVLIGWFIINRGTLEVPTFDLDLSLRGSQ